MCLCQVQGANAQGDSAENPFPDLTLEYCGNGQIEESGRDQKVVF